jgi:peptidyl-prolyl cis-trans isomerase D
MLQQIRDRITGKFALAILALIALPFVFFGINYNFIGLGYAAKVNGEEISVVAFETAYRNQLLSLAEQGTEIPTELRSLVRDGVLDSQIRDVLLEQYLDEAKFEVSDDLVTDFIQREATWQVDGEFSREAYYLWLEQRAIGPAEFEASQRQGLERNQLQRGIAATAFVTPSEYRRYLNLYGEQRQVSIAEVDIAALTASIEVGEDEIQAFYDERPDDFRSPESVDLSFIELRRDALADTVEITEDELQEYYAVSSSRFLQDEQRQARHILIPFGDDEAAAEQEAAALAARAAAGEPFEDLARQYSKDAGTAQQGGDLGMRARLSGALGDAIFSMERGKIEGPVRTNFGFHVIRLDEIRTGGPLPLAEIRTELERELRLDKAEATYARVERELANALFDADSIATLGAAVNLEVKTAAGFQRSGGEPFGANQAAIDAIFSDRVLQDREISDIVELDATRSIVVAVDDYHEAARRPLAEVRDGVINAIRSERAFAIANERVAQLETALRAGTEFSEAAAAVPGVEPRTIVVSRQATDGDGRIRAAVFQEKKPLPGQPRIGTAFTENGNYAVYSVTASAPGRPESIPLQERDDMKLQLGFASGSQDFASLIMNLEQQAEIVKSEDVLAADSMFE